MKRIALIILPLLAVVAALAGIAAVRARSGGAPSSTVASNAPAADTAAIAAAAADGIDAGPDGDVLGASEAPAAAATATPMPRRATDAPKPGDPARRPGEINFLTVCRFSHRAADDPIVFPGVPGASHSHDFFGNRTTNAASTYDSLRASGMTSCNRTGDTAAYWAPSLLVDGQLVQPLGINAYYRTGGKDPASIQPFPAGLRVIAGDAKATAAQPLRVTSWGCFGEAQVRPQSSPPTCPFDGRTNGLKLTVLFPDCWDGVNLDSADHKSHMVYSVRGQCPASHPVPVPMIAMNVRYPTAGGADVVLASGNSPYTGHADFFNAWDQATLEQLVRNCLNASVHCGATGGGAALQRRR